MVPAKLHGKQFRIDVRIDVEMNNFSKYIQSNFTLISLITFEVINQTSSNLQGSCCNTSRWCLQNYLENGWELTSNMTSKWITLKNTQSNFRLISLITFEVLNQLRQIYSEVAVIHADGACKITWKTVENWRVNWRRNEWLLKIFNQISH